ncbi:hypothetical protein CCR85_02210 [Rhodothalassium salexigens]|uniref:nucleoside-diphosphate sugar epimerase/dehydratase n=1 Tax=Rhodothalassium salexigens TaxID=1086 RepID=UPI0019119897|nr:hypothetical protein [Rhodothalassium salexigens]MBK5910303.1 hypothetical protein [Rhodothalassium salexigens]MBK5921084.1 hypothetical protein [Rhodothalassium salexigens]
MAETQAIDIVATIQSLVGQPGSDQRVMLLCQILAQGGERFVPVTPLADPAPLVDRAFWDQAHTLSRDAVTDWVERGLNHELLTGASAATKAGRPVLIHGTGATGRRALTLLIEAGHRPTGFVTPRDHMTAETLNGLPVLPAETLAEAVAARLGTDMRPFVIIASSYALLLDDYEAAGYVLRRDVIC